MKYKNMLFRPLGKSGLKLPVISLGLWYNFGEIDDYENSKEIIMSAFENGITHFDLANNYGPPAGSAETTFGRVLKDGLINYRDQIIISTKAGYGMWEGPYGDGGSRKYLMSSLDQSLLRLGISYVDIFYHHRFDPETPLKETMLALRDIVLQGKALYVGLSNYNSEQLKEAYYYLDMFNVPYVVTQPSYSMLNRWIEGGLLETQSELGGGIVSFSTLQQGLLTNKYLKDIPLDSRAMKEHCAFLNKENITPKLLLKLKKLNEIALNRGQTLSQLAISWCLRDERVTSVLVGVSKMSQLVENIESINNLTFTENELKGIEECLKE